jgi:hypothetical protein
MPKGNNTKFQPGNQFWKARSSHGAKPIFSNPQDLSNACREYLQWVDDNPLYEDKIISFQGVATHVPTAKMRAATIGGLCLFLDISRKQWFEWRNTRPDLSDVIDEVECAIREQKFTGAAADLLNANIISRDLGLADRTEHTGKDNGPIQLEDLSPRDAARELLFMLAKAKQVTTDD